MIFIFQNFFSYSYFKKKRLKALKQKYAKLQKYDKDKQTDEKRRAFIWPQQSKI